jgi:hypothetical protein
MGYCRHRSRSLGGVVEARKLGSLVDMASALDSWGVIPQEAWHLARALATDWVPMVVITRLLGILPPRVVRKVTSSAPPRNERSRTQSSFVGLEARQHGLLPSWAE